MTRARQVPDAPAGGPPLSFLVDFDGTIARTDVQDVLLNLHATDPDWKSRDDDYLAGRSGSRGLIAYNLRVLDHHAGLLRRTADAQPHDETFPGFARWARAHGTLLEVVSDGLGFYVHDCLARMGLQDLPVATNEFDPDREPWIASFPYGHPRCFVCGTCKRERVLHYQARGFHVAFVGDGLSDRYAAVHADTVVAKDHLVVICEETGIPYVPWRTFDDVRAWLDRIAADPGSLASPRKRPYTCGPEAWGPGRTVPPREG